MTKLMIPMIITMTVLAAGIFALMPVEQATAVHTTIQGTQMTQSILDSTADLGANDIVCDSDAAFVVFVIVGSVETNSDTLTIVESAAPNTITMTGEDFVSTEDGSNGYGDGYSTTIAAPGTTTITVGGVGVDDALVSLTTTSGATADCTDGL